MWDSASKTRRVVQWTPFLYIPVGEECITKSSVLGISFQNMKDSSVDPYWLKRLTIFNVHGKNLYHADYDHFLKPKKESIAVSP